MRQVARSGGLMLLAFLLGLIWGHNWWALGAGLFGAFLAALTGAASRADIVEEERARCRDHVETVRRYYRAYINKMRQQASVKETLNGGE